jgi:hypothetical protein
VVFVDNMNMFMCNIELLWTTMGQGIDIYCGCTISIPPVKEEK